MVATCPLVCCHILNEKRWRAQEGVLPPLSWLVFALIIRSPGQINFYSTFPAERRLFNYENRR